METSTIAEKDEGTVSRFIESGVSDKKKVG